MVTSQTMEFEQTGDATSKHPWTFASYIALKKQ
jgi:hypothetical protein